MPGLGTPGSGARFGMPGSGMTGSSARTGMQGGAGVPGGVCFGAGGASACGHGRGHLSITDYQQQTLQLHHQSG
eukprot:1586345-Rhodomonas_salina.1